MGRIQWPPTLSGGVLGSRQGVSSGPFSAQSQASDSWCKAPLYHPPICLALGNPVVIPRPLSPKVLTHTDEGQWVWNLLCPIGLKPGEIGALFPWGLHRLFPGETGVSLPRGLLPQGLDVPILRMVPSWVRRELLWCSGVGGGQTPALPLSPKRGPHSPSDPRRRPATCAVARSQCRSARQPANLAPSALASAAELAAALRPPCRAALHPHPHPHPEPPRSHLTTPSSVFTPGPSPARRRPSWPPPPHPHPSPPPLHPRPFPSRSRAGSRWGGWWGGGGRLRVKPGEEAGTHRSALPGTPT